MRKTIILCQYFIFCAAICNAQLYKSPAASPAFSDALNKIVASFRTNYYSIQGNIINAQEDADVYETHATLPGAVHSFVYRFHSAEDTTASWQAIMYSGDSFKEASKVYKNIFKLVNNSHFAIDNTVINFTGEMEEPTEDLRFTASPLKAISTNPAYRRFFAEVEMINSFSGWEVHLNLHNKKDDRDKF